MSNEPHILPEDHEQYERDFYDNELKKLNRKYSCCLISVKAFVLMLILSILFVVFFSSCAGAKYPPISVTTGTVISVDGDNVLVAFEVINKTKGSQSSNWFYCPRNSYQKGDKFPDPTKESNHPRP